MVRAIRCIPGPADVRQPGPWRPRSSSAEVRRLLQGSRASRPHRRGRDSASRPARVRPCHPVRARPSTRAPLGQCPVFVRHSSQRRDVETPSPCRCTLPTGCVRPIARRSAIRRGCQSPDRRFPNRVCSRLRRAGRRRAPGPRRANCIAPRAARQRVKCDGCWPGLAPPSMRGPVDDKDRRTPHPARRCRFLVGRGD